MARATGGGTSTRRGRRGGGRAGARTRAIVGATGAMSAIGAIVHGAVVDMDLRTRELRARWRDALEGVDTAVYVVAKDARERDAARRAARVVDHEIELERQGAIVPRNALLIAIADPSSLGARGSRAFDDFFAPTARLASASARLSETLDDASVVVVHHDLANDRRSIARVPCPSRACESDVARVLRRPGSVDASA
ncbi:unnamed product [Ostreococcus tauri]|uniref:Unnamed product n=1 Tax=Ostreococcus tauri TaxID=70448 RepID=A0A090N4W0_OSTTA|nr:unnamed product [Ostreococcus tauri]CEG01491.1 unnamed product [Ostreococcus tauri]|eukprot:XP_022840989.1 unnamed product [Ostreococcus tauri]